MDFRERATCAEFRMTSSKADAYEFLQGLSRAIKKDAPPGSSMEPEIRPIVAEAKTNEQQKPNFSFLRRYDELAGCCPVIGGGGV
jgi:hypothetical protein